MPKDKTKKQTPLTLEVLIDYNREIFVPELKEFFVARKEFDEFKNKSLANQDEILTKLSALTQEKTVGDEQDKRQKKVLEIHNNVLKKNKLLSDSQVSEIDKLRVF